MRAVDLTRAKLETRGLENDRRWMVIDAAGNFMTQRKRPLLATIAARITENGLSLSVDGGGVLDVARPDAARRRDVVVWDSTVSAACAAPPASAFLSDILGEEAHLVFMDDEARRMKDSMWTPSPEPVSFADAFPVLVTSTGSLAALNRDIEAHGGAAVPMARFRPNIVVDCDEDWPEDNWRRLKIGGVELDLVKPCDRCIVTTTDQRSGARMGPEPIASLARIHRSTDPRIKGVIFGMNAAPRALGDIAVGDSVEAS
ncbi:MOSC domain-containing protein [Marinicaulis flavus]|uniref:MOSC domain-containing protein n=2 Tax=Hyphococcus luteus TaxID=2058213 RepID=A0A2S7K3E7_9PROT|nr:MOSC domain-containing protein [Marinicaulis flavus]